MEGERDSESNKRGKVGDITRRKYIGIGIWMLEGLTGHFIIRSKKRKGLYHYVRGSDLFYRHLIGKLGRVSIQII